MIHRSARLLRDQDCLPRAVNVSTRHANTQESSTCRLEARTNHIRRIAARAGLRIASMRTDAGRLFVAIDGTKVVAVAIGFDQAGGKLRLAAAV